jgi:2-keto-3-deoxy-L-rhamnonate aldolase RhmA
VVALPLKKREAVENLDAILDVPGVDMVQFGPADYSMSAGLVRHRDVAAIREVETHVITAALRHGIAPRAELANPSEAEYYLEMGVRHFCIGHDVGILHNWWTKQGARMRALLDEVP